MILENAEKCLEKLTSELDESAVSTQLSSLNCHFSNDPTTWNYSCYLFYLISNVLQELEVDWQDKSEILSINQLNSIVHAVQECCTSSLEVCVKKSPNRVTYNTTNQADDEYRRLVSCLRMFHKIFALRIVSANSLFDCSKLDYIIGTLSVICMKRNENDVKEFMQIFANISSTFPMDLVFKFLFMIKGFNGLPKEFQGLVHRELMKMIRAPNGFHMLCRNLLVKPEDSQVPLWQKCSLISRIIEGVVGNKAHQKIMIDEIFRTLDKTTKSDERDVVEACVSVLKTLEAKDDIELRKLIHAKILEPLGELIQPDALLFGSIVMEQHQLTDLINRIHILFSSSTIASLPSIILNKHIQVLFGIYANVTESAEREKLASVIVFFLSNRDRNELQAVIKDLRLKDNKSAFRPHPRIFFKNETFQVGAEQEARVDDTEQFLTLLRDSNNNFLIYDVFLCLINILGDVQSSGDNFLSEYNVQEEDLPNVLHRKFFKKLAILEPLQEMIQWKALHSQLNEKPKEVLDAIKQVLMKSVEKTGAMDEQLVIIFFSIFKELICKLRDEGQRQQMEKEIIEVRDKCKNPQLRQQIDAVFSVKEEIPTIDPSKMAFDDAMKLIRSPEIYCKVYGSDTLIKLLKKRDQQALLNRHTILAVALQNLKETESYAYLNVIKLLVALTYVMDTEVVEALVAEYQNKELETDERLKLGEVIVKVTEDLGPLSVKFKQPLIKCFLSGSRDHNNEFRTSSLANLGTVCKVLSYQIHSFFQEMLQQVT